MFIIDVEQNIINIDNIIRIYREYEIKFDGNKKVVNINIKAQTLNDFSYVIFSCRNFDLYKKVINYIISEIENNSLLIDVESFINNKDDGDE